ncbi:MAG: Fe-S-containing protein [Bacteroidota bacterium]
MIESFIITLREGVEVALVLGILIVHLRNIHREELVKTVFIGLGLASVTSIVVAFILHASAIDSEVLEGYLMLLAAVFVGSMVVWMWITAKGIRRQIESKVNEITQRESRSMSRVVDLTSAVGKASLQMHIGILLLSFLLVLREGIETVIFLQAVAFSTKAWWSLLGTTLGLSAATVFAVLFIQGSVRIDIGRFLKVTAVVLLVFVAQLLVNAIHEFYEFGVLPTNPEMMGLVGPIVRHNLLFILAILSVPALMLIIPGRQKAAFVQNTRQRRLQLSAGLVTLSIVFFLGFDDVFSTRTTPNIDDVEAVTMQDGVVRIPIERVQNGTLHRYVWTDGHGLAIRFFVLRTGLGTYATAFDACRACYDFGRYYLLKGDLVCSQCDAPHPLAFLRPSLVGDTVDENMSGSMEGNGCAPIYLLSKIEQGEILITAANLNSQRKYFDY